jgi:peptide/nickel transport system substrate-binding protein
MAHRRGAGPAGENGMSIAGRCIRHGRAARAVTTLALSLLAGAASALELSIGVRGGADTMDPHFDSLGNTVSIQRNIYDPLVSRDAMLEPIPALATSWTAVDDRTWEFKLRPGVTFHDGSRLTAADVVYSFKRVPTAKGPTGGRMIYMTGIVDVVAVDELTVRILTDEPTPLLPRNLAQIFIIPAATGTATTDDFNSGGKAIGTGPYRLVKFTPKDATVVARHDGYWGGQQPFTTVSFKELLNDSTRVAALLSGDVDLINYVPTTDVATLKTNRRVELFSAPSVYIFQLYPDTVRDASPLVTDLDGRPLGANPLKDVRVREAISLAINRQAIVDRVLEGYGMVPSQLSTDGFYGTSPNLKPLPFDLDRSKALLAEAGWAKGFGVTLTCTADRLPNDGKVCAALGAMLTRAGIKTTVSALPRAVYFPAFAKQEHSLSMSGWGSLSGETSYILNSLAHSYSDGGKRGGSNNMRYANPAVDAKIQAATTTMDEARRAQLLAEAMELYIKDYGTIPVVNLHTIWAGRADKVAYTARADEETQLLDLKVVTN